MVPNPPKEMLQIIVCVREPLYVVAVKKIITGFQKKPYDSRIFIGLNFRSLKMSYGLITSLPRSIGGY
jgi:hypothetical protein